MCVEGGERILSTACGSEDEGMGHLAWQSPFAGTLARPGSKCTAKASRLNASGPDMHTWLSEVLQTCAYKCSRAHSTHTRICACLNTGTRIRWQRAANCEPGI
jgi:hypothetical protein